MKPTLGIVATLWEWRLLLLTPAHVMTPNGITRGTIVAVDKHFFLKRCVSLKQPFKTINLISAKRRSYRRSLEQIKSAHPARLAPYMLMLRRRNGQCSSKKKKNSRCRERIDSFFNLGPLPRCHGGCGQSGEHVRSHGHLSWDKYWQYLIYISGAGKPHSIGRHFRRSSPVNADRRRAPDSGKISRDRSTRVAPRKKACRPSTASL